MTTTTPQATTEPHCTNSCSGCKNCDHHFCLRDNGQLQCKHCLYSRPVTRFEVDAISLVGQWNYEEPFWWTPIATALAKEFREGQTRAALRQYFCSCGGALTAEEYIIHYFDLGHDRGDPVHANSVAFTAYNQAIEDAKAAIRGETVDDPYAAPTFINAIARKCSPHVYVNRLAATAAPQQLDARPSCWHCGVVLAYAPKLRCEDCPDECDVEGCEELGCAPTATPVGHAAIPLLGYERVITIEWDKHNARRHELIEAKRSRPLSDEEVSELRELQWLAGIKRQLGCGPLPAPVEQKIDEATMEWALRELADGWITNNEREGPHGFYQNARRVLEAIVSRRPSQTSD